MKLTDLFEDNNIVNPYQGLTDDKLIDIIERKPSIKNMLGIFENGEYVHVFTPIISERVQIAACNAMGRNIWYIIQALKTQSDFPSEAVQIVACERVEYGINFIIEAAAKLGKYPSEAVQIAACKAHGYQALWYLLIKNIPVSQEVIKPAFDKMLEDSHKHGILSVLTNYPIQLPIDTEQKIYAKYPDAIVHAPESFPNIIKPIVDNLRTALSGYSLETVHRFIEVIYKGDEDAITTLKHRANAIQRKLDQRK